jgi:outer membrane protein assembly factor BamB
LVVATERDKEIIGNFWYGQGDLVCVDTNNGKTLWRVPTQGMVPGSPTFHKGLGLAIVGSNDFFLYAVEVDSGQLRHQLPTKGEVKGTPALWNDTVITLSIKGWCQSFDLVTGALRWEKHIGYEAMHPEPLVIGDKVYMVARGDDGIVFCLDCNSGEIQWLTRVRGNAGWGVTRRGDQLLATGHNGYVVTLNKDTGEKILYSRMDMFNPGLARANVFTPPVIWKNRVIWVTNDKGIACFEFGDQQ